MERLLEAAMEHGGVGDAAIAQTESHAAAFWALRENQSAAQKSEGAAWKHDVAVPVSAIPAFLAAAGSALEARWAGVRIDAFGHVGDGNIHYDVLAAPGGDPAEHNARRDEAAHLVHDIVMGFGGSISAEHGLGTMKTAEAAAYKSAAELAVQRAVRAALDPKRIMNPRVLF